jgi:hypothetical protein
MMRALLLLLIPLSAIAGEVVLDNPFVRVTRDGTACAAMGGTACGERVIVALDALELAINSEPRRLARGDIAIVHTGDILERPAGFFFEVMIKPDHPLALAPAQLIPPDKNAFLHDAGDFFVFEEKLATGDTRARHSHSQRVVIQLNRTRLQQFPDGEPEKIVETVPDKPAFSPAVVHTVKNIGDQPLRGVIVEFKP